MPVDGYVGAKIFHFAYASRAGDAAARGSDVLRVGEQPFRDIGVEPSFAFDVSWWSFRAATRATVSGSSKGMILKGRSRASPPSPKK
ncbi:hypothetical protein [Nonomuraea zeae]|uniref:Uncharacterized protein n=1 Tax=Nonomuraea zeae TaxID=1642303 RepID=A0A5S4GSU8_9ACTN|nr:hypothetical protein [Nonomuraea zeae]TMR29480.1 hypothetical protein ETD85_32315 [Nonomuraea zeae]